jgi:16S rRNA processing protein RimM
VGELYLDGCPVAPDHLRTMGAFEWRGVRGETRTLYLKDLRPAALRLLVKFSGVGTREEASALTNGTLWADSARLPDPGPGVSYAFELVGMQVVDPSGRPLGRVADVIFNADQPLLQIEGEKGKLLPCQPPFLTRLDRAAGVITLDLPAGFDEF